MTLQVASYISAFSEIQKRGYTVIGADYIQCQHDLENFTPYLWKAFAELGDGTTTPCGRQSEVWSNISHHALLQGLLDLCDIAQRISHQMRVAEWRLREISICYQKLLHKELSEPSFNIGEKFSSEHTWLGFLSIQSFLVDACVLRDYLAEYAAWLLNRDGISEASGITRMSKLKKVLNSIQGTADHLKAIRKAVSDGAWLTQLGEYRDLVVHSAPLEHADRILWARTQEIATLDGFVACVRLPLPMEPKSISSRRAKKVHLSAPGYGTFANALDDDRQHPDGLEYAHTNLVRLAWLAWHLSVTSPIEPKPITLGPD